MNHDVGNGGGEHESYTCDRQLTTKLRIRLQAANLPRSGFRVRGGLEWPDTYAIVTSQQSCNGRDLPESPKDSPRSIWGRTEVIFKNRNPQWIETIDIDNYESGSKQHFYVILCQHLPSSSSGMAPKSFGTALFEVSDILGSPNKTKVKRLRTGGCVFCRLEVVREESECPRVSLQVGARGLDLPHDKRRLVLTAGNIFHKEPDTIFEILKSAHDDKSQTWTTIHRSPPVNNSLNPTWDATEIDLNSLCNNDLDHHLRFHVYMIHKNGNPSLIGLCETTLRYLLESGETCLDSMHSMDDVDALEYKDSGREFQLQRSSTKLKDVGRLKILHAHLVTGEDSFRVNGWRDLSFRSDSQDGGPPSSVSRALRNETELGQIASKASSGPDFHYYVEKGCELDVCVAIDFTSSNGDPRDKSSYHFQDEVMNDYEEAIVSIGSAIARYSKANQYTVWGFGAKFQDGIVRHIFQCGHCPVVHGIDGIVSAYRSVFLGGLTMSGPTIFTEVLQAAAVRAKKHSDAMTWQNLRYTVLVILTDGVMDNYEEMQRKLLVYSSVPLSVIFVGIGRSDFRSLKQLCRGQSTPGRQITSFVDYRHHHDHPTALGAAAMRYLPSQVCEYMESRGFR